MAPPVSSVINSESRIWCFFKTLFQTVNNAVVQKHPDSYHDLEEALRKYKPDFISLLRNPPKNNKHREDIKKAATEGIQIEGIQTKQTLTQEFIEEALILSDLFELDEYASVELLIAGENQLQYFPGLTRGLVAVLLYYDGRRCLIDSLRTLIQSREGRTWTLGLNKESCDLTTKFTKGLMDDGLTTKILGHITEFSLEKEIEKLHKAKGLGKPKHRKQVTDLINDIRTALAECLFNWSCQTGLSHPDLILVINHLKMQPEVRHNESLDPITLCLLMSVLYSIDVSIIEDEDREAASKALPALSDNEFIPLVHKCIMDHATWKNKGLKSVLMFAWSVTLRTLSQNPVAQNVAEYCEKDEEIVNDAVQEDVFQYLCEAVITAEKFHSEEFYLRRIHNLIAEFLVQMPLKVKELRNSGDEVARIILDHQKEGLNPPSNLRKDFENLLKLIGKLYAKDPLKLELAVEYWCPSDSVEVAGFSSYHHLPQRQISLYKFVRLAGDLLPPSLYIPYIEMLTGLANGPQCARHCYNLLKANGNSHVGGQASTVSWDHFFHSFNQYYTSLRHEAPVRSDIYQHVSRAPSLRGITPQELEGLISVMKLTKQIATQDESARVALCENQQWVPVALFFGLLSCSVPPALKAELLRVLAAFAKSPDIAVNIWQNLEASQILRTVPSTSANQSGGIKVELDEVEARAEEFHLTRGFLKLISSLIDIPIPPGLGAGHRSPGFDPYLNFIRDDVFLKFNTRAYKNPSEKWEVASLCVSIFYKLLYQHDIQIENFLDQPVEIDGIGIGIPNKPPGHTIMVHLLNDGNLLKMLLYIIDDTINMLGTYSPYPGKESQEILALDCLKIIQLVLEKQDTFFDLLRESGAPLLADPLDRLLLGINARSAKADHMLNIVRFICHNSSHIEHSLLAVQICTHVCQNAAVQHELVRLFSASENLSKDILHGFVECLETEVPELLAEVDEENEDQLNMIFRCETRHHIMKLLLQSCDYPAPNIAHYLLGFQINRPVEKTSIQDPGVLGSPRTCLHSILDLLNEGLGTRTGLVCIDKNPVLAELGYHLVYLLCANKDTADPILRYLRTTQNFLYRHVQYLPFATEQDDEAKQVLLLQQQSWLLKAIAIELRVTSRNRQRSHTQRLLMSLLDDSGQLNSERPEETYVSSLSFLGQSSMMQNKTTGPGGQTRRQALRILDSIGLSKQFGAPDMLQLEFFDISIIEQVLETCQRIEDNLKLCDVKALEHLLISELNKLQGASAGTQRGPILQEIECILSVAQHRNSIRRSIHARKDAFEGWRQVIEIILTACPIDLLDGEERQAILFELVQDLFLQISEDSAISELTSPAAGVILTLLANLHHCFLVATPQATQTTSFGQQKGSRTLYASSLQMVLKGIIESILRMGGRMQRTRSNLYGALMYCLQIARKPKPVRHLNLTGLQDDEHVSLLSSRDSECEKLARDNLATIQSYGEAFMEIVCRDACDGHEVSRMLALSTIDYVLSMDKGQVWLSFLQSKGYLLHLIESLPLDDEELKKTLHPNPEMLKALYIYESKMGLLIRVAGSASGAQALLHNGLISQLAQCSFLDMRPDMSGIQHRNVPTLDLDSFIPSIMIRYRQLLFPALRLCLAIMTSLGSENREVTTQILRFVIAHSEVFCAILRSRHRSPQVTDLQELALVTSVTSRAVSFDDEHEILPDDNSRIAIQGQIGLIQHHLMALLTKYCPTERLLSQIKATESTVESGTDDKAEMTTAVLEIASNVVAYCRTLVAQPGMTAKNCRILFSPVLSEAMQKDFSIEEDYRSTTAAYQPPNLGIIVQYLKQCTDFFITSTDAFKKTKNKLSAIADLSADEIKELLGQAPSEKVSTKERHQMVEKRLDQLLFYKVKEIEHTSYLIENSLFLLWRHLEYYLLYCKPSGSTRFQPLTQKHSRLRKLQETRRSFSYESGDSDGTIRSHVSQEELDQLKLTAVSCIKDDLFRKLQDIEQSYARNHSRFGFMDALVSRIKRLLRIHASVN